MRSPSVRENTWGTAGSNCLSYFGLWGRVGGHFGLILGSSGAALEAFKPKWLASSVLERSLGALGASWELSGGRLGPSWAPIGALLGCLAAISGRLGAVLGPS